VALSVTVLGCDASYAGAGGACSGYLVRSARTSLWVDCGPGTLANVQEHLPLSELDAVLVSHQHPDHFGELPVLYNALAFYEPRPPLPVYTTAGAYRLTTEVNGHDCTGPLDWQIIDETSRATVGDISVRFSRTDHPVETLAMCFEADRGRIAYSADTGPGWSPARFGDRPDVLVMEATLLRHQEDHAPHLSGAQAGRLAAEVDPRCLVLTHRPPGSDPVLYVEEAVAGFGGRVEVAAIGRTFVA
jgi:ribonuclease BN (tRNA processing enzyme)